MFDGINARSTLSLSLYIMYSWYHLHACMHRYVHAYIRHTYTHRMYVYTYQYAQPAHTYVHTHKHICTIYKHTYICGRSRIFRGVSLLGPSPLYAQNFAQNVFRNLCSSSSLFMLQFAQHCAHEDDSTLQFMNALLEYINYIISPSPFY